MKKAVICSFAMLVSILLAEQAAGYKTTAKEREARKAKFHEIQMKKNGGILIKPGSQQGHVLIANIQKRVPNDILELTARQLAKELRIDIKVGTENEDVTSKTAAKAVSAMRTQLVLFIVDHFDDSTSLLIAPENRWGMVNVAPLAVGATNEVLAGRVRKEISRAFAMLAGAMTSQYQASILSPIFQPEALDEKSELRLPYDVQARVISSLPSFGITPYIQANYRKACQEGWAPAPTNEFQKAIFEQVKSDKERGPTNPITIPPPNAKK